MTIQYYQDNATSFFENTIDVDMEELYKEFVDLLPPKALILDAGCGSGRDSKAFLNKGFKVEAFDASSEMVKRAKLVTGINVELKRFNQVNVVNRYDGIWTCASLLHVPEKDLLDTLSTLSRSLKVDGVWYMSFKYGTGQREKDGRLFTDMNEERLDSFIQQLGRFEVIKQWLTKDKRSDRSDTWLNIVVRANA